MEGRDNGWRTSDRASSSTVAGLLAPPAGASVDSSPPVLAGVMPSTRSPCTQPNADHTRYSSIYQIIYVVSLQCFIYH